MAKAGNSDDKKGKFVNFDFDKATKSKFKEWAAKQRANLPDIIDKLVDSSYGISAKVDSFNGGYASFIVPSDPKSPNFGWILSGRAGSASNAMLSVLYRHLVVFSGNWPKDDIRRAGLDDE